jgi:acyl-CoA thioesterase FadM
VVRTALLELPTDTCQFNALQFHPFMLLSYAGMSWSHWMRTHLVSFQRLVTEHQTAVVVLGSSIRYLRPFLFHDAEQFTVSTTTRVRADGALLLIEPTFLAGGVPFAQVQMVYRHVHIEDPQSMAAVPAPLPDVLLRRFEADEILTGSIERPAKAAATRAEAGALLAQGAQDQVQRRSTCEVADQWSFMQVPTLVEASREALSLASPDDFVRASLGRPLSAVHFELTKPFFAFDPFTVATAAHRVGDELTFVHRLLGKRRGPDGQRELHGLVTEQLPPRG